VIQVYLKPACGVCKKAKAWLDRKGIDYEAIDIISRPPTKDVLARAIDPLEPKRALNARSTAFRNRGLGTRPVSAEEALDLMVSDPNLIKRPFVIDGARVYQGFEEHSFAAFLA
jgi:arsenate reductase